MNDTGNRVPHYGSDDEIEIIDTADGYNRKYLYSAMQDDKRKHHSGMTWDRKPAIVRYIGRSNKLFTKGKLYEAFFVEYWEGVRNSLHVRNNDGVITDFNPLEDFEIVSDEDNVLNDYEATVRCITHKHEDRISGLIFGKEYKAIGCDRDGLYLVKDESGCCYFYSPLDFEIVNDEHSILSKRSVFYNYYGRDVK